VDWFELAASRTEVHYICDMKIK